MGKGAMGRPSLHSQHEQLLPTKQLRAVVLKMHDAFPRLCAAWNEENAMRKNWALLFSRLDTDGSGRLDYWEFRRVRSRRPVVLWCLPFIEWSRFRF